MALSPMTKREVYVQEHERFAELIRAYSLTPKGMRIVSDAIVREQFEWNASLLLSMNVHSRIAFADALQKHLLPIVDASRWRKAQSPTIAPSQFTYGLGLHRDFDLDPVRAWFKRVMSPLTYFGIIEVALYEPASREMASRMQAKLVASWHMHAVLWNTADEDIRALEDRLRGVRSGVSGLDAVKIDPVSSSAGLQAKLTYISKAPIRMYRAGLTEAKPGKPAKPWIRKARPRPAQALTLCKLMQGITIEQLCLEGGSAVGTIDQVLMDARVALQKTYDAR